MHRAAGLTLTILLAIAPIASASAQDWTVIPLGTTANLRDLAPTFLGVWVVGDDGFAARSASVANLAAWSTQDVLTSADLLSAIEISAGQLWITGEGGVVRLVYGNPYTIYLDRSVSDSSQDFVAMTRNSGRLVALGNAGGCYRSDTGGLSWYALPTGTSAALHRGLGFVDGPAHAVGDGGTILELDNSVWSSLDTGITADLFGSATVNGLITAVGAGGMILQGNVQGTAWTVRSTPTMATLRDIDVSGIVTLAVGDGGTILKSTDGGATWCALASGTTADLFACSVISNTEYLVAGAGGVLLRTTTGGGECTVAAVGPEGPQGRSLSRPYPNPLHDRGQVRFQAPRDGNYQLQIYDVRGRRVAEVFTGALAAGQERTVGLVVADLPAGVYYLRLVSGAGTSTQRFTVVR